MLAALPPPSALVQVAGAALKDLVTSKSVKRFVAARSIVGLSSLGVGLGGAAGVRPLRAASSLYSPPGSSLDPPLPVSRKSVESFADMALAQSQAR